MRTDTDAETDRSTSCLSCGGPATIDSPLCSLACLQRANTEVRENVNRLRSRDLATDERVALAARNGQLTSALIRW